MKASIWSVWLIALATCAFAGACLEELTMPLAWVALACAALCRLVGALSIASKVGGIGLMLAVFSLAWPGLSAAFRAFAARTWHEHPLLVVFLVMGGASLLAAPLLSVGLSKVPRGKAGRPQVQARAQVVEPERGFAVEIADPGAAPFSGDDLGLLPEVKRED